MKRIEGIPYFKSDKLYRASEIATAINLTPRTVKDWTETPCNSAPMVGVGGVCLQGEKLFGRYYYIGQNVNLFFEQLNNMATGAKITRIRDLFNGSKYPISYIAKTFGYSKAGPIRKHLMNYGTRVGARYIYTGRQLRRYFDDCNR
ncbi:MAG: hypothetical protein GY757_10145 [bacterium]|nr:hypothetical protein [bacterium]